MKRLQIDTLEKGWQENDEVMLHACFQILTDFVEKELEYNRRDNKSEEKAKITFATMVEFNKSGYIKDANVSPVWNKIKKLYLWWKNRKHEEDYDEDTEKLLSLIKIRKYLWT